MRKIKRNIKKFNYSIIYFIISCLVLSGCVMSNKTTQTPTDKSLSENVTSLKSSTVSQNKKDRFVKVSTGVQHTIALGSDGSVWAWGNNVPLGDGTVGESYTPKMIITGGVTDIATGAYGSCAIKTDGSLWAWGDSSINISGVEAFDYLKSPTQIMKEGVKKVFVGWSNFILILKTDNSLWACGDNLEGQLGDGTTETRFQPVKIFDKGILSASGGSTHSVAMKDDGSLWACGCNEFGQLGDGTKTDIRTPKMIISGKVKQVSSWSLHTVIIKEDGSVWAWGSNNYGQLGDGTTEDSLIPKQIIIPNK